MLKFRDLLKDLDSLPQIYCDMDEVLVDFIPATNKILKDMGHPPLEKREYWKRKYQDEQFWPEIRHLNHFWETLPPRKDMKILWNFIKPYKPNILSAVTEHMITCEPGKRAWLRKHIRGANKIHLVNRDEKQRYAVDGKGNPNILIDDYHKNCNEWRSRGGIAIQHTSAKETIQELKKLGYT